MKKQVIVGTIAVILGYWGISLGRSLAPRAPGIVSVHDAAHDDIRFTQSPAILTGATREPASVPAPAAAAVAPKPPRYEFQTELESYTILKAIVLPNEDQRRERIALITNGRFLASLASRLTKPPLLEPYDQDVAVDILLDALKDGDRVSAEQGLRSIVQDAAVEDISLERTVREKLAGIKAEVMYHWAAVQPGASSEVASMLPGPVSQKIWQNVLRQHESNFLESQSERN